MNNTTSDVEEQKVCDVILRPGALDQLVGQLVGLVVKEANPADELLKLSIRALKGDIQAPLAAVGWSINLSESNKKALGRELIKRFVMVLGNASSDRFVHFLPQTEQILRMEKDMLSEAIVRIIAEFATNPKVYQRAMLPFFKGQHSDTIHGFVRSLRALENDNALPEQLKISFIDLLQQFHDDLKAGHSRRTLSVLQDVLQQEFPLLRGHERQPS